LAQNQDVSEWGDIYIHGKSLKYSYI
jgi:hypothetical protein